MTYRVRNIVIAVVLAAMAALMTSFYVTNYKRQVRDGEKLETVFVAAQDIPAGTPGAQAVKMLKPEQVAKRNVVPGAVSSPDDVTDQIAVQTVFQGEQVTTRRFNAVNQAGVQADLKGNLRAFQIQGTSEQVLAGTLKKGDKVDLVGSFVYKIGQDDYEASRVVLRDVKVLRAAAGPGPGAKLGGDTKYTIMLAVTDSQASKLKFTMTFADDENGQAGWSLQLRPVVDDSDSPENVETLGSVLRDGLNKSQVNQLYGKLGGQ